MRPDDLDSVIHERVRLSIVSVLAGRRKVKYLELRSILELTDGNLAGHIRVLEKAGYVEIEKTFVDKKTRTSYRLTQRGRRAFQRHVERLAALLSLKAKR
ncbi:MAG: transcriptional regulator [Planctomycetota bacterium]|nr:transcriptional regulator [Planctomycetota bacterium]